MPKRKLELNPNPTQQNDTSILRTLKKLTTSIPNNQEIAVKTPLPENIDNTSSNALLTPALTQVLTQVSTQVPTQAPTQVDLVTSIPTISLESPKPQELSLSNNDEIPNKQKTSRKNGKIHKPQIIGLTEMSKWHSETEQKVYKAMYQETKIHNTQELYFTFLSLSEKTGFRNPRTIRAAIQGLIAKKSIAEIINKHGEHLGIRYRVFSPEEIVQNRIKDNVNIDFQSKKIV
jgi:hypothetical protein